MQLYKLCDRGMTQQEFEARAIEVSSKEFDAINMVYMNSDLDKDEFCKMWCKMNASRVKAYKQEQKTKQELEDLSWDIAMVRMACQNLTCEQYGSLGVSFFKKSEIATLRFAGIEMEDKSGYVARFLTVSEVLNKVNNFLAA